MANSRFRMLAANRRKGAIALAALLLVLAGCKPPAAKESGVQVAAQGLAVQVKTVETGTVENRLSISGYVAPSEMVMAFAKVPGKLVENLVKEGDRVEKDQLVARVNQDLPGLEFKDYEVKAPISGVVAKIVQDAGSLVGPTVPVASIINMDQVKVTVNIIESEIGAVSKGLPAEITVPAWPDKVFRGAVSNILPTVDPMSHAAKVEIMIPNPDHKLKPGMSATARLRLGTHAGVLTVPRAAIIEKMGEKYVYLFDGNVVKRATVQTGYGDGENVELLSGVKAGDRLITTDLNVLKDGQKVRVVEESK